MYSNVRQTALFTSKQKQIHKRNVQSNKKYITFASTYYNTKLLLLKFRLKFSSKINQKVQ